jgi:tetratricopeptide (TPR) repeat protein
MRLPWGFLRQPRPRAFDTPLVRVSEAIGLKKDYADAHNNLGNVLRATGQLDVAIAEYRKAIRIDREPALVHCSVGVALRLKGLFAEALRPLRRGHELGLRQRSWSVPSR